MARPFSSKDAQRIIEDHRQLLSSLNAVAGSDELLKQDVQKGADALVAQEVLKVLGDIPIEEINHEKRGIRVDDKTFGNIIKEEIDRINAKHNQK